jgi:hypothetical protein
MSSGAAAVWVGEPLAGWLEAEAPAAAPFRELAEWLERVGSEGLARVEARREAMAGAAIEVSNTGETWKGPNGEGFRAEFSRCAGVSAGAEPAGADGYRALVALAVIGREVAAAVDRVNGDHRNRIQAAAGMADEWMQRGWTNVQDVVGLESDAEAEATRREMDERNLRRERYEAELQQVVTRWQTACQGVAAAVQRATQAYGAVIEPGPALAGYTEYHEEAEIEWFQRRWVDAMAEPHVMAHADDPAVLNAWWDQLSLEEKQVLMTHAPELVEAHLWQVMSVSERNEYEEINKFKIREEQVEAKAGVAAPGPLPVPGLEVEVEIEDTFTARVTTNSDRTVDVYLSAQFKAGAKVIALEFLGGGSGVQSRAGVTVHFESREAYERAIERLRAAVRADRENPGNRLASTREVLAEDFVGADKGFELANNGFWVAEVDPFEGVLKADQTRMLGAYVDTAEGETGVYLGGEVTVRVGQLDAKAALDGQLYFDDDMRCYARVTLTVDASASVWMLPKFGIPQDQLAHLGLQEGAKGIVQVTVTTEATHPNRDALARFVGEVNRGSVDPSSVSQLHAGSELTVAVRSGTAQREMVPPNPDVNAELNGTDTTTVRSFRKVPDGDYYEQKPR